ncbi:hypothetical protein [Haloarcula sp. CGMCC 1.2071]|uniref:hypothetical protein n=1 Tax=Haloarcula sp. CGMCC 1.2071 TaxID=3111454 RepID=UPI00300F2C28
MKIIITMAGRGSRFKNEGIETLKHRLYVRDRTIFNYSLSSLSAFFDEEFVFATRAANDDGPFIREQCADLGIDEFDIVELESVTDGQATTALAADQYVDDEDAIAIYNIDTYIEEGTLRPADIEGDAWIPVFSVPGDKWSFVERDQDGTVTAVAEKERISDLATVGFYHFATWRSFKDAYAAMREAVKEEYGETYICPLYSWLIDNGDRVTATEIDDDSVHVLGTPEDVVAFEPAFAKRHNLDL